jgi:hypothetical protein
MAVFLFQLRQRTAAAKVPCMITAIVSVTIVALVVLFFCAGLAGLTER